MEQRELSDLRKRIESLEQDRDGIAENEKMLLRIAKLNRFDLQETKVRTERVELFQGDTNERLDRIEQTLEKQGKRMEHSEAVQAEHSESFDRLEHRIDGLSEAVDGLGKRVGSMDEKLDKVLQLLQK